MEMLLLVLFCVATCLITHGLYRKWYRYCILLNVKKYFLYRFVLFCVMGREPTIKVN